MKGIIYTDKAQMEIDLQSTASLNEFEPQVQGEPRHIIRNVNTIPYTYFIEHPDKTKWAIICDETGKIEALLGNSVELGEDWFNNDFIM